MGLARLAIVLVAISCSEKPRPAPAALGSASGSAVAKPSSLEGIWEAHRSFGPAVRGTLELVNVGDDVVARIAGLTQRVSFKNQTVSFELPDGKGSFIGRRGSMTEIPGHWIQPPTVNDGARFASPLTLRPNGDGGWLGEVVPLEDEWTIYLVISRAPDGTLGGFIRNPDRNMGVFWKLDRIEHTGDRVKLVGKWRGRGDEQTFGEGTFRDGKLAIDFPQRGGVYDFTPLADNSKFYARGAKTPPPWRYQPPPAQDDGWQVTTLDEAGMTAGPIAELVKVIDKPATALTDPDIHGLLVARDGKLVVEEYFHGYGRDRPHETRSAAKSVTATLVGSAIATGQLALTTRVYDLLSPKERDPKKRAMTVEHLLTMASGYDCDDGAGDRPGSENVVSDEQKDPDYYRYTLQLPMELAPGKESIYCSINPNLLGAVLAKATGRPLLDVFHDGFAEPLGIKRYHLNLQPTGEPYFGGGQKYLPRDFMKMGQMMLDRGVWNGKRIISKEFATRAGSPLVTLRKQGPGLHYGYLWWTIDYPHRGKTLHAYFATGNGGQVVVVIPELQLVVAGYGGSYAAPGGLLMANEYIPRYILPAVK